MRFCVNPPAGDLGSCCAVLNGVAQRYEAHGVCTALSLKTVRLGSALYVTRQSRHLVTESTVLILNHHQEYDLEFQGPGKTETVCPFFAPGFLEEAAHNLRRSNRQRLDEPNAVPPGLEFSSRLYPKQARLRARLERLHRGLRGGQASEDWLEDHFFELAGELVGLRSSDLIEVELIPATRKSTREELYRRLHWGRDFLSAMYRQPVSVAMAARAARLSPYHFHRTFKAVFQRTPMQYVQECRLGAARRWLVETDEPISTICHWVGFESWGSFSTLFANRFGLSPRDFRKAQRARRRK